MNSILCHKGDMMVFHARLWDPARHSVDDDKAMGCVGEGRGGERSRGKRTELRHRKPSPRYRPRCAEKGPTARRDTPSCRPRHTYYFLAEAHENDRHDLNEKQLKLSRKGSRGEAPGRVGSGGRSPPRLLRNKI